MRLTNIQQGQQVTATATLLAPLSVGGLNPEELSWKIEDSSGTLWASGLAVLTSPPALMGDKYKYVAQADIQIGATVPDSDEYTLVWQARFENYLAVTTDDVTVVGAVAESYGAKNLLDMPGGNVDAYWFTPIEYDSVSAALIKHNDLVAEYTNITKVPQTGGWLYTCTLDTSDLQPDLENWSLAWKGTIGSGLQQQVETEMAQVYLITPSIWQAAKDMEAYIQRASTVVAGQLDITFTPGDLLQFLKHGKDMFNAMYMPTLFTMTNAKGPIKAFWIVCSQIAACRAQYLAEGHKTFDFTGQATTLSVDRTPYWESAASALEAQLESGLRQLKTNLAKRGQISGDGSQSPIAMGRNAMGAVGVTVSPVSNLRGTKANQWFGGWIRRLY